MGRAWRILGLCALVGAIAHAEEPAPVPPEDAPGRSGAAPHSPGDEPQARGDAAFAELVATGDGDAPVVLDGLEVRRLCGPGETFDCVRLEIQAVLPSLRGVGFDCIGCADLVFPPGPPLP